jgi:hypothetical protein
MEGGDGGSKEDTEEYPSEDTNEGRDETMKAHKHRCKLDYYY